MEGLLENFRDERLSTRLEDNLARMQEIFKKDDILRTRTLHVENGAVYDCAVLFMDGMINTNTLNESIIRPLLICNQQPDGSMLPDYIMRQVLFAAEIEKAESLEDMLRAVLYGDTILLVDGSTEALLINTKGWRTRGISEPNDERVLQGPREGFDEAVMLNVAMIRRKLPTPDLCVEYQRIGRRTDTRAFLCYLDSVVNRKALRLFKERLKKIDIDGILDVNYINELTNDNRFSFFKTAGTTERPDIVVARLLEGRIAMLVDGTPVALTLPYLFSENFQSDDDYYLNYLVAGIGRVLRYLCFFLAISVPSVYLALITMHKQLLPTTSLISIAEARGGVPFPSVLECIMLILIFEILRETGIRMPQSVGHALSIVGGLVVGQAAVEAHIVSAPMLIIVALSGIAGLMIPRLKAIVFYGRIALVLLGYFFGLYGYFAGMAALLVTVFSLRSFGLDYTSALHGISFQNLKDSLIRASWRRMYTRPNDLSDNQIRMGRGDDKC